MADLQVKTANICNITSSTLLKPNADGSGTYIADNSISVHMANSRTSGIYVSSLLEQGVIGDKYTISFVPVCATNNVMLVVLYGTTTQISFTSGNRYTLTITATYADKVAAFYGADSVEKTIIIKDIQIEKGETATPYRPYSVTGWVHSLRKLGTATDTFTTLPADIYADGNNATVGISGNTVQSGTPTPDNPVMPQGTGKRTENLFDKSNTDLIFAGTTLAVANEWNGGGGISKVIRIPCEPLTTYTISGESESSIFRISLSELETVPDPVSGSIECIDVLKASSVSTQTFTTTANTKYILVQVGASAFDDYINVLMLNTGSTAFPYEPWGIKTPISSANTTTPVYLGEVESTRRIKKYEFTGQENNWKVASGRFYNDNAVTDYMLNISDYAYCTHFNVIEQQTSASPVQDGDICFRNGLPRVYMRNDNCADVSAFTTWLQQQYANGTPVTVWYVLAKPTTGIVNEPLCKIGDYADTVSGITIPTITSKDTFDVDTTLKPSEVSLSYTGWHDATVEEWDGSQWQ